MEYKYIYGPIPSRRLGFSLGISVIPKKTCNYSCIYCQLGRTDKMTNRRKEYFILDEVLSEFDSALSENMKFDVVSIVGEGEPTLFSNLGTLIQELKRRTVRPVCVITNGALLYDDLVRNELMPADIVLPSLNAYNEELFKKINRPIGGIHFQDTFFGLKKFSETFTGEIWLEIMLMDGINDDDTSLEKFKALLKEIRYDRLYLNTPVRPPAEGFVSCTKPERMKKAAEVLGGLPIDFLSADLYQSADADDYQAIISNIQRHPMNQHEINAFLKSRNCKNSDEIIEKLHQDESIDIISYKGYTTYRLK